MRSITCLIKPFAASAESTIWTTTEDMRSTLAFSDLMLAIICSMLALLCVTLAAWLSITS
jgi:hypothetical protein